MKNLKTTMLAVFTSAALLTACNSIKKMTYQVTKNYTPDNKELYDTIEKLDHDFFEAYNTCNINLETYGNFFSEDIEFYHDQGGLMTSKADIISSTKKYICGKVTRELVPGSLEVYPIKDHGAVEIGLQNFRNNEEPVGTPSKIGRFMIIWENKNGDWKIKRVVSLH